MAADAIAPQNARMQPTPVRVARLTDPAGPADGTRVLVERLWPRGASRTVVLDGWYRQLAPSDELRTWYGHDPDRFAEFADRYRAELREPDRLAALARLRDLAAGGPLTLLTASTTLPLSQAAVLADVLTAAP
ncbi:MAG: hypothetical protein QOI78_3287 [Actinomycetota bacterium]|nr:hypothetical protein [Actinomycetota bacterium]